MSFMLGTFLSDVMPPFPEARGEIFESAAGARLWRYARMYYYSQFGDGIVGNNDSSELNTLWQREKRVFAYIESFLRLLEMNPDLSRKLDEFVGLYDSLVERGQEPNRRIEQTLLPLKRDIRASLNGFSSQGELIGPSTGYLLILEEALTYAWQQG